MKKSITGILLAVLILFSNSGWAITFHYCENRIYSVSLDYSSAFAQEEDVSSADDCCGENDKATSDGDCCEDIAVTSATSDSISTTNTYELQKQPFTIQYSNILTFEEVSIVKGTIISNESDYYTPPLYKLYCCFVFYA